MPLMWVNQVFFTSYWSNARGLWGYWSLRPQNNLIKEYMTFYCTLQALYNLSTGNNCLKEGKELEAKGTARRREGTRIMSLWHRLGTAEEAIFVCIYYLRRHQFVCSHQGESIESSSRRGGRGGGVCSRWATRTVNLIGLVSFWLSLITISGSKSGKFVGISLISMSYYSHSPMLFGQRMP